MARKKVLVIAPSSKTRGGITAVINQYATTRLWADWNCKWIETQIDKGLGLKLYYFIKALIQLWAHLPSCHLVHVHLSEPPSAIRKCFFVLPAMLFRRKIILHFHSFSVETTLGGRYKWLYSFLFSRAHCVIALSTYWAKAIAEHIGRDIIVEVVYNPCPNPAAVPAPTEREKFILFAGTLNTRKGFRDLILAFARVAKDFPDWKVVLAGNGEIDYGLVLADELNIGSQVSFAGWVSGDKKDSLFKTASIFCLPSYAEGLPMAVLDAMGYGIPVISTPVGGMLDFFDADVHALIFKPGDIGQLALHLRRLIADQNLRIELSKNASEIVNTDFSLIRIVDKIDRLYSNLIIEDN